MRGKIAWVVVLVLLLLASELQISDAKSSSSSSSSKKSKKRHKKSSEDVVVGEDGSQKVIRHSKHKKSSASKTPEQIDAENMLKESRALIDTGDAADVLKATHLLSQPTLTGNRDAMHELANLLYIGTHPTGRNTTHAVLLFEKAASLGCAEAQHTMALFYRHGLHGLALDSAKAMLFETFASKGGSKRAKLSLGTQLQLGSPLGCKKAAEHYNYVASKLAPEIQEIAGIVMQRSDPLVRLPANMDGLPATEHTDPSVLQYFAAADPRNRIAQTALGNMYLRGLRGEAPNPEMARMFLEQAVAGGDLSALSSMGLLYLRGLGGVEASNKTALDYFTQGARKGHAASVSGLGYMHLHGMGVSRNTTNALELFFKAAEAGSVSAHYNLGMVFLRGIAPRSKPGDIKNAVAQDLVRAIQHLTVASHHGHVLAAFHLSQLHLSGQGTPANCPLGLALLRAVLDRSHWGLALSQGLAHFRANELETAMLLYLDAADQGFEVAAFNAAHLLHQNEPTINGSVTVPFFQSLADSCDQLAMARGLYERSTKLGSNEAHLYLGDMAYYGHAMSRDMKRAAHHYTLACEANIPQAMYTMGFMHQFGLGVPQDFFLAKRYYDRVEGHVRGSFAVATVARTFMYVHWGVEIAREMCVRNMHAALLSVLSLLLGGVVIVLLMRRSRRQQ